MPGPITYAAILFLARDRLGQIRDMLQAKITNGGARVNDIEKQVRYLADQAYRMMTVDPPSIDPPLRLYGPPLGDGVSKFALLGALGPDITKYSVLQVSGQEWLWNTLHKGTADEDKEKVLTHSTDFVLDLWTRLGPLLRAEYSDTNARQRAFTAMKAYLLGHVCHVAADVLSHPYVDDVTSHLGTVTQPALDRSRVTSAIEVAVSRDFLGRGTNTRGDNWADWWPAPGDVPNSLYTAYVETIAQHYGAGGRGEKGFGAFEQRFRDQNPPVLDAGLIKDGYSTFRTVTATGATWDFVDWMGATWFMFVPALLAMPFVALLPNAKNRYRKDRVAIGGGQFRVGEGPTAKVFALDEGAGDYEALVYPFVVTSLLPFFTTLGISLGYTRVGVDQIMAFISSGLWIVMMIAFFASLGEASAARWVFIFVLPLLLSVIHILIALFRGGGSDKRRLQLVLGSILHILLGLVFFACYAGFLHFGIEGLVDDGAGSGAFWGLFVVWLLILAVLWMVACLIMRYLVSGQVPGDEANAFATGRRHLVRLFDDTTLFRPVSSPSSPALDELYYPSGRRPLLKMWWGANDTPPSVRVHRDKLVFSFDGAGPGAKQTIFAPLAPTKPSDLAALISRKVKDSGGTVANPPKLHVEVAFPADVDPDYELPPGELFADVRDDKTTEADRVPQPDDYKVLEKSADKALIVYHGLKSNQATRFGRSGPVIVDDARKNDAASPAAGRIGNLAPPNNTTIKGVAATDRFLRMFRPGDIVQTTTAPIQSRVVVSVEADDSITVCTPFATALPVPPAAGVAYKRAGQDRNVDLAGLGLVNAGPGRDQVTGVADGAGNPTTFGAIFRPGDTIRVQPPGAPPPPPIELKVVRVNSDTQMTLEGPLSPAPSGSSTFVRVADEQAQGFAFVADADDNILAGDKVMNHAADLAVLLCMGVASHLIDDDARAPARVGTTFGLNRVYQVFRNWNLDRRRINEWKMLVAGGAVSEKRGDVAGKDAALPPQTTPSVLSGRGEPFANELGWLPLLRAWLDMARRPGSDTKGLTSFRPGDPTNLDLSRAIAFLLDMRDPVPAP